MGFFSSWRSRGRVEATPPAEAKRPVVKPAETRGTTAARPLRLEGPAIGFLNLLGEAGAGLAKTDRHELGPMFAECRVSAGAVPRCEVLLLYCDVDAEGRV